MRFLISLLLLTILVPASGALADDFTKATVYKDPNCGCCHNYVSYLRENGFEVEVVDTGDLSSIKQSHGVPEDLATRKNKSLGLQIVEILAHQFGGTWNLKREAGTTFRLSFPER